MASRSSPARGFAVGRGPRRTASFVADEGWRGLRVVAIALTTLLVACGGPAAPGDDVGPGTSTWTDAFATAGTEDEVLAVAAGPDGAVAYGGRTVGDVGALPNQGGADGFVVVLEADGTERWRAQIGTVGSDHVAGLAVRDDGVVVAVGVATPLLGGASLAFVRALDGATGAVLWNEAVETTEDDVAVAVVVDSIGRAYVAGHTRGAVAPAVNQGFRDVFVARVSPMGAIDAYAQFGGASFDDAVDLVRLPGGDVVLVGTSGGDLPGAVGEGAFFAARFAPDLLAPPTWVIRAGGPYDVNPGAAAVDRDGDVVVVGQVSGQVGADPAIDDYDVFVARVAAIDGATEFVRQVGTVGYDEALGVAVDAEGRTWVAGATFTIAADDGDRSEAAVYVFDADDVLLRREVVPVGAHAGANALALVGDREVVVGGWSAATMPGFRPGWDGFVVRRNHAP